MKSLYITALLTVTLIISPVFAADAAKETPTPEQTQMMMDCNLAARNSLINADIRKVEATCTNAINEMEKSFPDKGYMINPMLNLAFVYSLSGNYEKAGPLLARARELGKKYYEPGSKEMRKIEDFIKDQEERKNNPPQFNESGAHSPH
jgi:hypothetical protein